MSDDAPHLKGPIAWMAKNPVASTLIMLLVLIGGFVRLGQIKQEVFPDFELDLVTVTVPYPGASPSEVEQGVLLALEEAVRGVDGVKKVTSVANEGAGVVSVELLVGADAQKALADVKNAVDRVRTLPLDAEDPVVNLATRRARVITLVLSGDVDRRTLHDLAEHARDELIQRGAATQIDVAGLPPLELSVELDRATLESYGLTLDDVARQIGFASVEIPGGSVKTRAGELLVRVADRKRAADEFADLVLRGTRNGGEVRLGQIATLKDDFADDDRSTWFRGQPAVLLEVFRVGEETPTDVADAVKAYVDELQAALPPGVTATPWDDDSELLRGRIDLLVEDGFWGVVLIFFALALSLDLRLAFWVASGIPTAVMASFLIFPIFGVSINMISLFALIVTTGILVDDAIVVSEEYHYRRGKGATQLEAAVQAAQGMAVPVTFAVFTTVTAFAPLLFVPGASGKIFRNIPIVVISAVLLSLLECYFILPAHLSHMSERRDGIVGTLAGWLDPVRDAVDRGFTWFAERVYQPMVRAAVAWRWSVAVGSIALFFVTVAVVREGLIPFTFLPKIEADLVRVAVRLPYGVPIERTEAARAALEEALGKAIEELDAEDEVRGVLTLVGQGGMAGGMGAGVRASGSHLLAIEVDLVPGDERAFSARQFEAAWQKATPRLPGVESIAFTSDIGAGGGSAVDVQLSHPDTEVLAATSGEVATALSGFPDLQNIDNTYAAGKPQLDLGLLPQARGLGLTSTDVARQVRSAFYGAEALREQRGREELKVMVRLPEAQRASEFDLEQLRVRTPTGGWVPLASVAEATRNRAPTSITREEGRRVVSVKAELKPGVQSARPVLEAMERDTLPALMAKHPGLKWRYAGSQESQNESLAALGNNFLIALFGIYMLMAVPFRSYLQPLIVMFAIPMGFVGAIGGHLLHGFGLSIISSMGIIAASGVVLNDSIVMVDAANAFRDEEGLSPSEAVVAAGVRRMRPIVLNSVTQYVGLASMIFEKSLQARFLVPMAISLGYGVVFATLVALVVLPAIYLIVEDVKGVKDRVVRWVVGDRTAPVERDAA